jgi:hypothetical protein
MRVFRSWGARVLEAFLTDFARGDTNSVGSAYHDLVDYLMLKYLGGDEEYATPALPRVIVPPLPAREWDGALLRLGGTATAQTWPSPR